MKIFKRVTSAPVVTFILLPLVVLVILFLLYYLLGKCVVNTDVYKKLAEINSNETEVLGVSSFDLNASKTKVTDNEIFSYTAVLVANSSSEGIINGTIVFNLTGQGRIGTEIQGPGNCLRITELRATCTAFNIAPNQSATWVVPVTAKDACSDVDPATLSMAATVSSVSAASEDTASVNCIAAGSGDTTPPATPPAPPSSDGSTDDSDSGDGSSVPTDEVDDEFLEALSDNVGSDNLLELLNGHNAGIMQCFKNNLFYVLVGLLVFMMFTFFVYFMGHKHTETTVAEEEEVLVPKQSKQL